MEIEENDVPVQVPVHLYMYKCRICKKLFDPKYAFTIHINKHKKRCQNRHIVFKSWKEVENHFEFCARRYGRTVIPARPKRPVPKNRPFKCQLCNRKYETYDQLFQHQYKRCAKRYLTPAWIVKI